MLWIGNRRVAKVWVGGRPAAALWRGGAKVWTAVSSCFGSGKWRGGKPWLGKEKWKSE